MSEEKEGTQETQEEVASQALTAEPDAGAGGGRGKVVVFALAGLLAVGAGAGAGFVWLRSDAGHEAAGAEEAIADAGGEELPVYGEQPPAHAATEAVSAGQHGAASATPGEIYTLDTFIVNIVDGDRDRYLKLKAELELDDPETADEVRARLPHIRDVVISLLGGKAFSEIRTIEGKNLLREEMLLRINSLIAKGSVRRIFFTEFVVQ